MDTVIPSSIAVAKIEDNGKNYSSDLHVPADVSGGELGVKCLGLLRLEIVPLPYPLADTRTLWLMPDIIMTFLTVKTLR